YLFPLNLLQLLLAHIFPYTTLFRSNGVQVMARILIVEDEALLRNLFSRLVGGQGHEVVSAASVAEAMARCREKRPDLIIADWMRSEEHTSELQSRENLVCRLLLEKK